MNGLPKGLHVRESTFNEDELVIADAQDHEWVTLHTGGKGDPDEWANNIHELIVAALELTA